MKIFSLTFCILLLSISAYAQTLNVHLKGVTNPIPFQLNAIDSITFTLQSEGLIAYYPLNSNVIDFSGAGNNGTVNGNITWVQDRHGNPNSACNFDGTNSYITIPNSNTIQLQTNKLTFALWFKCTATPQPVVAFLSKNNSNSTKPQYAFHLNPIGTIRFIILDQSNVTQGINHDYPFQLNQWYFIAATWDGSTVKIYVNDSLVTTQNLNVSMQINDLPLEIGRDVGGATEWYQGVLDEIRIYNRDLSSEEISSLFNE